MRNINKILVILVAILLVIGMFLIATRGFNYSIEYKGVTELKFMLGQVLDMSEVESIAKEALNNKEMKIQKIDYFNDSVNISVVDPTDEEIQALIDKFNSRYGQNNTMESISIIKTADTSLYEIAKHYIVPVIIAVILVAVYMGIRFRKQGILKVTLLPIVMSVVVEALYLSALAILQIPVSIWTMPIALVLLLITLTIYAYRFEVKD